MPTGQDWLMALLGGVGGAFTGYGQDKEVADARALRQAAQTRQGRLDDADAFTQRIQQRAALDAAGFRPTASMAAPPVRPTGMPGMLGAVPTEAMVGTMRRGETLRSPDGGSYMLDRLSTPSALAERERQTRAQEARAEIERRAAERRDAMAFESSENDKQRKFQSERDAAGRRRGLSESQSNTAANLLASRYDADPIVKNAKDVAQSYGRILATEDSAAGDLSLIFAYMKMLDPGSVVREGEFANAQNAAGVPDIIRNSYNRAATGERLNPNQRVQFRTQAKSLADQQRRALQQTRTRYSQRAIPYGIDPDLLFSDPFDLFDAVGGGMTNERPPYNPEDPD